MKLNDLKALALDKLKKISNRDFEVNLFLRDIFDLSLVDIHLNSNKILDSKKVKIFLQAIERRKNGEPYSYILNYKEFFGRKFYVNENVLIPRPETELMIEACINKFSNKKISNYLDLCTGSGCIGITISKELNVQNTILSDISPDALEVSKINSSKHNVKTKFIESDLFEKINGKFDLITINPPYVPLTRKKHLDCSVRDYEPDIALYSGSDGLKLIYRIINDIVDHMNDEAVVFMEFDETQGWEISNLLEKKNLKYRIFKDYCNFDRFVMIERR